MNHRLINVLIFILLALTWGSSFILMKIGLQSFSSNQVASMRLLAAGISLLPFFFYFIRKTPRGKLPVIILSGLLGNGIPAYLFCLAETQIDSSLAGILNSLTPLFALLSGIVLFKAPMVKKQLIGICVGLIGVVGLFAVKGIQTNEYWYYSFFVIAACICYGLNIALVHHYLKGYSSLQLGSIALFFMAIFALPILLFSDIKAAFQTGATPWESLGASAVLGIMGTGVASVLFYQLIKRAGGMMASMVTYALPVVAIGWGFVAGESISWLQVVCMGIILSGVYLANNAAKKAPVVEDTPVKS
ncbi:DMT family transporter [Chitinophaga skermanii]|uniref:DMT family transporter n=1 Tax=Chitinophaga skermanii TaxID=331697 RepID=UPI0013147122|nr:DMT family transporter [Chitinophaga skermanii]